MKAKTPEAPNAGEDIDADGFNSSGRCMRSKCNRHHTLYGACGGGTLPSKTAAPRPCAAPEFHPAMRSGQTCPLCGWGPKSTDSSGHDTDLRPTVLALLNRALKAEAEVERLRVLHLECFVCKASLQESEVAPHCTDCHVDDDLMHDWEEWLAAAQKRRAADGSGSSGGSNG